MLSSLFRVPKVLSFTLLGLGKLDSCWRCSWWLWRLAGHQNFSPASAAAEAAAAVVVATDQVRSSHNLSTTTDDCSKCWCQLAEPAIWRSSNWFPSRRGTTHSLGYHFFNYHKNNNNRRHHHIRHQSLHLQHQTPT